MQARRSTPSPCPETLGRLRAVLVPALMGWAWQGAALAADDGIVTDRPDFVESSDVVGPGRVQVEVGVSSEKDAHGSLTTRTTSTPTLLRIGVGERAELRVETDGVVHSRTKDRATGAVVSEHGAADTAVGIKWHLRDADEAAGMPSMALLAHVDLSTGSPAFRGHGLRPSLRAVGEWDLPSEMSVGVMPGVAVDTDEDGKRFASGILAVTLGKAWTPSVRTFVELAGQSLASSRHGGSVVTFDAGATWLASPSLQWDVSLARGLTSTSPDLQLSLGVSVRF